MAPDDHLLEVEDLGPDISDGVEKRACDAGTVVTRDSDQQGMRCEIGHAARLSTIEPGVHPVPGCRWVSWRSLRPVAFIPPEDQVP